jgi:uncharacterized repeat protein (TIGR03803 family)
VDSCFLRLALVPLAGFSFLLFALASSEAQAAPGWSFVELYALGTNPHDGLQSQAGLFRDNSGNLYGTTIFGGNGSGCDINVSGCGAVFKIDSSGNESTLYAFNGVHDGWNPTGRLIADTAGNLYGTTQFGGLYGYGTVFKLDSTGSETILHHFRGGSDGANPNAGIVQDTAGNFYGTTRYGGRGCNSQGCGTVFKISASGQETILHRFLDGMDGANPLSGLAVDSSGNIYGTAWAGGLYNYGTVFEINRGGEEKILHHFAAGSDGSNPVGGVTFDQAGNLYGTASGAGTSQIGIVFTINTAGKESVLYTFTGSADGAYSTSHLLVDAAGNIFGMASQGVAGWGSIFEISGGTFTLLYYFSGTPVDGGLPVGGLTMDSAGNLYGTTSSCTSNCWGTVFELQKTN